MRKTITTEEFDDLGRLKRRTVEVVEDTVPALPVITPYIPYVPSYPTDPGLPYPPTITYGASVFVAADKATQDIWNYTQRPNVVTNGQLTLIQ